MFILNKFCFDWFEETRFRGELNNIQFTGSNEK